MLNTRFETRDVANLGEQAAFDLVTAFDAVHDQAHPRAVLKSIYDALKDGGVFLMMDEGASSLPEENVDGVIAPLLYTFSTFHCMTVSLAYGGEGLGTCWGRQKALALLAGAGFADVDVKMVDGDLEHYYLRRLEAAVGPGRSLRPCEQRHNRQEIPSRQRLRHGYGSGRETEYPADRSRRSWNACS